MSTYVFEWQAYGKKGVQQYAVQTESGLKECYDAVRQVLELMEEGTGEHRVLAYFLENTTFRLTLFGLLHGEGGLDAVLQALDEREPRIQREN